MRQGKTLTELAQEIERVERSKRDFIAPTTRVKMLPPDSSHSLNLEIEGQGKFDIGEVAHSQLSDRLDIPRRYYEKMRKEDPNLLSTNVNTWLHTTPEKRMLRTLDGRVRAFLSNRYRPLDNYAVASATLPVLHNVGIEIKSAEITERRLYIQAVTPRIQGEVKQGEIIQAGVVISNSEVGCGSVRIESLLYFLACLNGVIGSNYGLASAVTSMANDTGNYDRVIELERIGGQIIELKDSEWKKLAA